MSLLERPYSFFYEDVTYLEPAELEAAYNSLPQDFKDTLKIEGLTGGEAELTGWDQFIARYGDKRLIYQNTPIGLKRAKTVFISIFFDNRLLLTQIKKAKEIVEGLSDLEKNWKTVTSFNQSTLDTGKNTSMSATEFKDEAEDKTSSGMQNISSDNNSSGLITSGGSTLYLTEKTAESAEVGEVKYPVNTLTATKNNIDVSKKDNNTSSSISVSNNESNNLIVNKSEVTNNAVDMQTFYSLELPQLRDKFWGLFTELFI